MISKNFKILITKMKLNAYIILKKINKKTVFRLIFDFKLKFKLIYQFMFAKIIFNFFKFKILLTIPRSFFKQFFLLSSLMKHLF
jgi:hypothetical protein